MLSKWNQNNTYQIFNPYISCGYFPAGFIDTPVGGKWLSCSESLIVHSILLKTQAEYEIAYYYYYYKFSLNYSGTKHMIVFKSLNQSTDLFKNIISGTHNE